MQNSHQINCPKCGTIIDVQNILSQQLEEEIKQKYASQTHLIEQQLLQQKEQLQKEREIFEQKKREENRIFQERLDKSLQEEKLKQEEQIKKRLGEEQAERLRLLENELREKSDQIKELNRTKAEIEILKREKAELKEAIEAESQRKLNEQIIAEKEKIRKQEEERNELKIKELQKQLEDQKKLTEEMKRKQEQGSMQLQGEVQELAIEEWLSTNFPLDTIEEIKKGARGGDCVQIVNTRSKPNCGKIYYESKRTKEFQAAWIEKFKADMREKGADIGVIVTEAMPSDMQRMGLRENIWICNFEEFKGLCAVLRETIIRVSNVAALQENKGDKIAMLYDYVSGNTFRMQVEAIIEGFSSLKEGLEQEKRAMTRLWKEREKQIEKVILNTTEMYGSIKGIGGSAIQPVKALELPFESTENEINN